MLRRFRSVLSAAAVVFATPPLAAQLPSPEVLPPPRPVGHIGGMTLPGGRHLEHHPQYFAPAPSFPLPRELAAQECPALSAAGRPADRPVGSWVREVGPAKVVLTFTADRLTATARVWEGDEKALTVGLDADYVVMKDGTVCGIITGIDADDPEAAAGLQPVAGHPFAFRWRADADVLSVRDVKCLTAGTKADADDEISGAVLSVAGRYTRIDDARRKEWEKTPPATRADRPAPPRAAGRCEAVPPPPAVGLPPPPLPGNPFNVRTVQTLPDGRTVERIGVDFNAPPPPPPAYWNPPASGPICVPPAAVLGPPIAGPAPQPYPNAPVYQLPPPAPATVLPTNYVAPPAAVVAPAAPKPHLGTWTRDVGAFAVTLKVTPEQIVAQIDLDPTGEKDIRGLVLTADYCVSADGKQIDATITGADVTTSKRVTYFESDEPMKMARELDGQPLRFEVRAADGVLSVRGVRVGKSPDRAGKLDLLAGVYTPEAEKAAKGWDAPRMEAKYSQDAAPRTPVLPPCCADAPKPAGPPTFTGPTFNDPLAMRREIQRMDEATSPAAANPLHGTWVREQNGMQVVLRLAEKRMRLELNLAMGAPGETPPAPGQPLPAVRIRQTFDADCGIGPDGTLFGVFTGADITMSEGLPVDAREGLSQARGELAKAVGNMFKFRVRLDDGALSLSSPQTEPLAGKVKLQDDVLSGRYERAAGKVLPPKPGDGAGFIINEYSSDPNVRVEQLLHQSEDVREIRNEWRRFWFNDLPGHLTTERVHSGIGGAPSSPPTTPNPRGPWAGTADGPKPAAVPMPK